MNTVVGDNNRITFRCYTPTGNVAVPPNYTLRIIPFQDMYVSVMFGNGGTQQVRAKAGQEYTIECPLSANGRYTGHNLWCKPHCSIK